MACIGPNPISRAAAPNPQLPSGQGYIGTGGVEFQPAPRAVFTLPGTSILTLPMPQGWAPQTSPGMGGDTPGSGGQFEGMTTAVQTSWLVDGVVNPGSVQHIPGSVGARAYRRSRA